MSNSINILSKTKKCNKCLLIKHLDEFWTYKKGKWTCTCTECKDCMRNRAREYAKTYRQTHPEKVVLSTKRWRKENREQVNKQSREWKLKNPEKSATIMANDRSKRRAKMAQTDITHEWLLELRLAATHCPICLEQFDIDWKSSRSKSLDHIIPLNTGGQHIRANVRYICRSCNSTRPKDGSDYDYLAKNKRL